jgi:para-nitrobenzyl esterase
LAFSFTFHEISIMKSSFSLTALVLVPVVTAVRAASIGTTIPLCDGVITGNDRDSAGILSFKGIPYASPPVGNLRWTSPTPPAKWKTTLDATKFGYSCWNNLIGGPAYSPYNEDCLTLNVWTGASETTEKRPVLVWIYGGGFQFGTTAKPLYDGSALAQEGVILVSFNYRLGVFGFLGLEELDNEGHQSGDFGLQDQLAALRWVQSNIAAFGGDPDNVTIFGESAGSHSVGILMASPLSHNLFHKAIMESGAWWDRNQRPLTSFAEARQYGLNFKNKLNLTSLAELRSISAADINDAQPFSLTQDPGVTSFAPSIDNYVIPTVPGQVFHEGKQLKIPLLAGFNAREEYVFEGNALPHATAAEFESAAKILFGDRMPEFLSLFPDNTPELLNSSSDALIGSLYIREQTWEAANVHCQTTGEPVFAYYYNYTSAYEPIASHTAEEPFVFGNLLNNPVIGSVKPPN